MKITVLIPHWCTGKMTAYAISQVLAFKGRHEVEIIVIDNSPQGKGELEYLAPFHDSISIIEYPKNRLQSHGIAFDYVMPFITTEWVYTMESDSFPTNIGWMDYLDFLAQDGVDCAGSCLTLSGGEYTHPAGMMFKRKSWFEADAYCRSIQYKYFPNLAMKEGFACHLMIHNSIYPDVLSNPDDYIEVASSYLPWYPADAEKKMEDYSPVVGPFHNGMGSREESVHTYGSRTINTDCNSIILNNKMKLIKRIGYEPGQWFSYWHYATGKKTDFIPTQTKWFKDRPGTQQEFTMQRNGFKHLWGISAWKGGDPNNEIAIMKQAIPNELYDTLPTNQKI